MSDNAGHDPLEIVFSEAEARAGTPLDALVEDHTRAALDAYYAVHASMEPMARGALAHILPRVLRDAAAAREAMRDDPAAPGLEDAYRFLLDELGGLAAVFATVSAKSCCEAEPKETESKETGPKKAGPKEAGPKEAGSEEAGSEVPDPTDEYAEEYRAICAEIEALMAASQGARLAWELIRQSRALHRPARGRPPSSGSASHQALLADDREYYL